MDIEDKLNDSFDAMSLHESVDIEYMQEMSKYEVIARRETESIDMSVDEENMIVCKIKEELLNQVRGEMLSELERYQMVTNRTDTTSSEYINEMDPIIRQGLYEIKRLDKILLRKIQKEKQVKRERILLQKRLQDELKEIENQNKMLPKEVVNKVDQFLAIKPPPRHNEGMNANTAEDDYPKLFQTEIIDDSVRSSTRDGQPLSSGKSGISSVGRDNKSQQSNNTKTSKSTNETNKKNSKLESEKKRNFVKRNIELASKAAEPVVFTDAEKDRLQFLLADLNDDNSLLAAVDDNYIKGLTSTLEENPFQMATLDQYSEKYEIEGGNDGILTALSADSDITSVKHQLSIESRLKHYMGEERYKQLSQVDDRSCFSESVIYQVSHGMDDDIDVDSLGDKTLQALKYTRENQERLKEIDNLLSNLKDNQSQEGDQLDPNVLRDLITSSRGNISATTFSEFSDLESEKEHDELNTFEVEIEHLSRDVLDSLLRDARMHHKPSNKLELISELTELSDSNTWDPSKEVSDYRDSISRNESLSASGDRPSSRFPDINLYKHLTSSTPKSK